MRSFMLTFRGWLVALTAVAGLMVVPVGAAHASAPTSSRMLTAEQLASDAPKTVIIDATTGKITASWLGIDSRVTTMISTHNICNPGEGCFVSGRIPYADQGFYGSAGTSTGSWPYRSEIDSGNYTVKACWGSTCSPQLSPHTQAGLSSLVTGTSFRIY
jgi:hypothetical protein